MNEVLREFLLETHENLALLDSDLVTLEQKPADKQTLGQVFRTLHSVKGTAGFIGLPKLQGVAHAAESLLSRLRDGELHFNQAIATAMLKVVDVIRAVLANIEASGDEGPGDYASLIQELEHLRATGGAVVAAPAAVAPSIPHPAEPPHPPAPAAPLTLGIMAEPPHPTSVNSLAGNSVFAQIPAAWNTSEEILPVIKTGLQDEPAPSAAPHVVAPVVANKPSAAPPPAAEEPVEARPSGTLTDANIRVDVGVLDTMMTLVGELVLSRNQILQYGSTHEDPAFLNALQRLNLITTELQASVMKTRMQPIGNVWGKFPRIVRDLAIACGKKVRFEMEGQETELDKTLLEAIRDPLTHMVRNAVDHGIEPAAVRLARGKPEEGRIKMIAFHEGGKVIVEMSDDGGGIDAARVREKAVQARLITPQDAARMSREELLRLIFLPGFSTADKVTQFSGRGVGMDVVRTSIERIGGVVDLESGEGQGTTLRMKIPLTLAIVPALICWSAGERYAIPQAALLELVRLDAERTGRGIEWLHGAPVYRLRGALLPLVFLDEQLGQAHLRSADRDLFIVVLQADERSFGLVVDSIRDTEEIVVKPLQKQLKGINVFAGAAIMGDGRVALILDVAGVAHRAGLSAQQHGKSLASSERTADVPPGEGEPLLLFSPRGGGQMAMPLSSVARLEELPCSSQEHIGHQPVVQYRDEILKLVDVAQRLEQLQGASAGGPRTAATSLPSMPVVVCTHPRGNVGLIVESILDIVQEPITAQVEASRPGVRFAAVIQGRVTEFLDLDALIAGHLSSSGH